MLGWQPLNLKAIAVGLGLILSVLATNVEAGVFGWLKRTEIQWSPEIHGVITEQGRPVVNMRVTRELYYQDKKYSDTATTNADGQFFFTKKTLKVRRVLFDAAIGLELIVKHPETDNTDSIFDIRTLNHLGWESLDRVMADMRCELPAERKYHELKTHDIHDAFDEHFHTKCSFPSAKGALWSDEEIEAKLKELDQMIEKQEGF
ncbi:DUF6795 domain-containing protein [Rheinheimera sp. EpRS3]|uniref:DUF6795 domain-containing protein n=1 Tax=Rheinheimera sp. EpRS3 TaxID=1712383 RepID=UPI0007468142|nr:carboxypeptidase-like regulatory domain-containing protein [Rheinheimera sp. EpRS3]KUM55157.1 hypothetical protein AR688_18125 [Rheinheimera sp. EpRS3]